MGLFKKKTDNPEQLDALRSEIVSLRERLDAADQQKADLVAKIETVDQVNAALNQRVDTVDQTNAVLSQRVTALNTTSAGLGHQVGALDANANDLATRVVAVDAEVERVRDGVAVINDQVGSVAAQVGSVNDQESTVNTLGAQVQSLAERLNKTPLAPPAAPDTRLEPLMRQVAVLADTLSAQSHTPLVDSDEVQSITARLDEISSALTTQAGRLDQAEQRETEREVAPPGVDADDVAAMRREMSQMAERMATLDHRMTNVSTELANQLTELSSDLDVLLEAADDPDADASDDSAAVTLAIEAVQNSTERLAAEQARYQITFREDLAELAERLRRPTR
jgi:chromosome segregation ATPase